MRKHIALSDPNDPYAILSVDFARDSVSLLVGRHSDDATPRLGTLSIATGEWLEFYDFALSGGVAACARYTEAGNRVVFSDDRGDAFLLKPGRESVPLANGVNTVFGGRDDALTAVSGTASAIVNVASMQHIWSAREPSVIAISRADSLLATAATDSGDALFVDFRNGNVLQSFTSRLQGISHLALDDRGLWLCAIGSRFKGCAAWNARTGARAGEIFCNEQQDNNMAQALHPTRDFVAYGTIAGYVVLVDLSRNETAYMEQLHPSRIHDLRFNADGSLLASAGDEGAITVIELDEMLSLGMSLMDRWR